MQIRKAVMSDTDEIYNLISLFAVQGQLLHRTHASIYENLQCFYVAEENEEIQGTASLHILDYDLAEVRSLVVNPDVVLKGIGKSLVSTIIDETKKLGVKRLISLTYQEVFFQKCGFIVVDKESLPQKIWKDCMSCSKYKSCDEIAMLLYV